MHFGIFSVYLEYLVVYRLFEIKQILYRLSTTLSIKSVNPLSKLTNKNDFLDRHALISWVSLDLI